MVRRQWPLHARTGRAGDARRVRVAHGRGSPRARQAGFTLIELLVVILIVGILVSIAIPSFLSQRQKAEDASAKASVHTAQVAEGVYATEQDGAYASETLSAGDTGPLARIEPALHNEPYVTATAVGKTGYTITVSSLGSTPVTYTLTVSDGTVTRGCSPAGTGGCSASGAW